MSAFLTRGLVAALIASASITGCTGKAPSGGPHGAGKPVPITVAYVRLGEASTGAPHVDSPKWVLEEAASAGLVIHSIGVWQELPKAEEYRLLVTNREIVNCRVVETREDGQVVFEASAHVSRSRKRLVLGPGAKESGLVHLSDGRARRRRRSSPALSWCIRTPVVVEAGRQTCPIGWSRF